MIVHFIFLLSWQFNTLCSTPIINLDCDPGCLRGQRRFLDDVKITHWIMNVLGWLSHFMARKIIPPALTHFISNNHGAMLPCSTSTLIEQPRLNLHHKIPNQFLRKNWMNECHRAITRGVVPERQIRTICSDNVPNFQIFFHCKWLKNFGSFQKITWISNLSKFSAFNATVTSMILFHKVFLQQHHVYYVFLL
jgi:hypothetical protein